MWTLPSVTAFFVTNVTRLIVFTWDVSLTLINLVTPSRRVGHVIQEGRPGAGGRWPEFIPPGEGDSRSACPGLNAMANHGILPRNGRDITFQELTDATRFTFNFASTFGFVVSNFSAGMLSKAYDGGTCALADISLHNGIEHDASLTRQDAFFQPNQGKPYVPYIDELLKSATGSDKSGKKLTVADVAKFMAKRRVDAKASNPEYSLSLFHRAFGFTNTSFLLTAFDGRVRDLQKFLVEERIPDGWEPPCRKRMGLTLTVLAITALRVELGADLGAVNFGTKEKRES